MSDTAPVGLSAVEAALRQQSDGRNELAIGRRLNVAAAAWHQLTDAVVLVLIVAATLTAAVGDATDTAIILAVVVLNTALSAAQEIRSDRALAALSELTAPCATVVRDGAAVEVDARDVVRGDLLVLSAGDIVAADAKLLACHAVQADESMLSGESVPVDKGVDDSVFAGTVIVRGRGRARVVTVGSRTAVGAIAADLRRRQAVTPLQRQLAVLGRRLAIAASIAAVLVSALNLIGGRGVETSLVLGISLAVAAIPESLPAVVSLSLALGARRMAARGILARRLVAVEALGAVTVLAIDKTGTLTEGRPRVTECWTPTGEPSALAELLDASVLCNDAESGDHDASARADPSEVALLDYAAAHGIAVDAVRQLYPRVAEEPFDAVTARMCTTHPSPSGGSRTICKGSPEAILQLVPAAGRTRAAAVADEWAGHGSRVFAVAIGQDGTWRLLGMLALDDPPRADSQDLVAGFQRAGVRPIMITGDHPATASAVGHRVGLNRPDPVVAVAERELDPDSSDVFARVKPHQKMAIVEMLRRRGEVVAMTGDGVNDAPALRAADVGIAMGHRGTEVAKQAADLVLSGDDISAMIPAIADGRRTYDNLRRFLVYAVSGGVAEVLVMILGPLFGFAVPLRAGQILWVNLLTHGLPGVAMGNEPAETDVLTRRPRRPDERLLDLRRGGYIVGLGALIVAMCLALAAASRAGGGEWQSVLYLTLVSAQLGVALGLRPSWRAGGNPSLIAAVVLNAVLAALAVSWTPLEELLHTRGVGPGYAALAVGAAAAAAVAARLTTLLGHRSAHIGDDGPRTASPTSPRAGIARADDLDTQGGQDERTRIGDRRIGAGRGRSAGTGLGGA